jgi:sodium-dependent phosphate cotransporter
MASIARRTAWFLISLFLFILALELIKRGASGLGRWVNPGHEQGCLSSFGLGWLLACLVLSGSPVAAIALSLLGGAVLNVQECFAMVMGSRIGAAFVVLAIGFTYDLQARAARGGVHVGALALFTTASVYLPAFALGHLLLRTGWLDGLRLGAQGELVAIVQVPFQPIVAFLDQLLPSWGQGLLGMALIVGSFKLFDWVFPSVDPTGGKLGRMATTIYRPSIAFLFGMIVTALTLSVSVSLTLLVPLTVRGVVRRENLIPYILGANITTFIDTLFASLLIADPGGFRVVLCAASVVTALSLPIVFLFYRPYERFIDGLAGWATNGRRRLGVFVSALFLLPLLLIFGARALM